MATLGELIAAGFAGYGRGVKLKAEEQFRQKELKSREEMSAEERKLQREQIAATKDVAIGQQALQKTIAEGSWRAAADLSAQESSQRLVEQKARQVWEGGENAETRKIEWARMPHEVQLALIREDAANLRASGELGLGYANLKRLYSSDMDAKDAAKAELELKKELGLSELEIRRLEAGVPIYQTLQKELERRSNTAIEAGDAAVADLLQGFRLEREAFFDRLGLTDKQKQDVADAYTALEGVGQSNLTLGNPEGAKQIVAQIEMALQSAIVDMTAEQKEAVLGYSIPKAAEIAQARQQAQDTALVEAPLFPMPSLEELPTFKMPYSPRLEQAFGGQQVYSTGAAPAGGMATPSPGPMLQPPIMGGPPQGVQPAPIGLGGVGSPQQVGTPPQPFGRNVVDGLQQSFPTALSPFGATQQQQPDFEGLTKWLKMAQGIQKMEQSDEKHQMNLAKFLESMGQPRGPNRQAAGSGAQKVGRSP